MTDRKHGATFGFGGLPRRDEDAHLGFIDHNDHLIVLFKNLLQHVDKQLVRRLQHMSRILTDEIYVPQPLDRLPPPLEHLRTVLVPFAPFRLPVSFERTFSGDIAVSHFALEPRTGPIRTNHSFNLIFRSKRPRLSQ